MNKVQKGIVLQSIKYGDTSLIVHILTEDLGVIPFMFKGVRSQKRLATASSLFPGALIELEFNHVPHRNFQYAQKTQLASLDFFYHQSVAKHCIMTYLVEVLRFFITGEQTNIEVFDVYIEALNIMNTSPESSCANLPVFFTIKIAECMGYKMIGNYSEASPFCDIENGCFSSQGNLLNESPEEWQKHLQYFLISNDWETVKAYSMHKGDRKKILDIYIHFIQRHTYKSQPIKSLEVLSTVLS